MKAAELTPLYRVADFDFSIRLWGYDVAGDIGELAATICEQPGWDTLARHGPLWDRDARWLETIRLNDAPPPWWMCLPWITEWKMRREKAQRGR